MPSARPSSTTRPGAFRRTAILACVLALAAGCAADVTGELADGGIDATEAALASCNAILDEGIYDEMTLEHDSAATFAMAKRFCDEVKSGGSGGGGIGLDLAVVGISLTGSGSSSSWTKYCQSFSTSSTSSESLSLMTRNVNPDIVAAWLECMTDAGGLACYQKPGQNVIGLEYVEIARSGDLTRTSLTPTNLKILNPEDAKPRLYVGDTGLAYTFVDEMQDGTFLFNGRTEVTNYAQSCSVVVKSDKKIRAEVRKTWADIGAKWKALGAAIDSLTAPTTRDMFEKRVYDIALLKYWDAAVHQNDCAQNLSSCAAPPVRTDYSYAYKMPTISCKVFFSTITFIEGAGFKRNVLVNTPADDTSVIRRYQSAYSNAKSICPGTINISG